MKDLEDKKAPIMNAVDYIIQAIEHQDFELFKQLCNTDYFHCMSQDKKLHGIANTAGERHFEGQTIV